MIYHDDILHWAETYQGEPFHAVLCDPPYGLNESELDIQAVLADWMAGKEHQPRGTGFMGREWDCFIPGPQIWRAVRRCCAPGAFLLAFGGTRTADLLALALRLAGWEKRDEIDWIYGSGFPKNQNISKAIDRTAKAERPVVGTRKHQPKFDAKGFEYRKKDNGFNSKERETFDETAHATELAQAWDGYGTALKPAHEPILVFRNPLKGTYAQNCTATGAGALNINGGRVGAPVDTRRPQSSWPHNDDAWEPHAGITGTDNGGRWPANLLLSHSPGCERVGERRVRGESTKRTGGTAIYGTQMPTAAPINYADADGYETVADWRCVEACPVRRLGEQSGESESKRSHRGTVEIFDELYKRAPSWHGESTERGHDDSGTAARFFFQADYLLERLEAADPVAYFPKSSRSEREAGLDPRQLALLGKNDQDEATINDGRDKPIDNPYQRGETTRRNIHPCLKPLALTRYLATLLLPPALYAPRRLLVPFSGVSSEMIGAMLAGWEEVVGVELEESHVAIAEARLAYWRQRRHEFLDPAKAIRAAISEAPEGQIDMFERIT